MSDELQRRYSEREVQLILKSAAELQRQAADDAPEAGGLSLADLERVAAEAGIDPALVRRAAAQLDTGIAVHPSNRFVGAPMELVVERVIDVRVEPEVFDRFLEVVRSTTHQVGEVSTIGRQFGWKGRLNGAKADVSVSAGDARTTVRIRVALDEAAVGHFMLKGTLFGLGGGLVGTALFAPIAGPFAPLVGVGVVAIGYAWARRGVATAAEEHTRVATELVDALAARAAEVGGPRKLSSS